MNKKSKIIDTFVNQKCYTCTGTGKVKNKKCLTCLGTGVYKEESFIIITKDKNNNDIAFQIDQAGK